MQYTRIAVPAMVASTLGQRRTRPRRKWGYEKRRRSNRLTMLRVSRNPLTTKNSVTPRNPPGSSEGRVW